MFAGASTVLFCGVVLIPFVYGLYLTFTSAVVLINVVAFLLAYMVTSGVKGQNFFRAGFFIPNLIGGIVLAS